MKEYLDFSHQKWYTPEQFAEVIDNAVKFILRITSSPDDSEVATASELADVLSWLLHIKELALNSTSHDEE